MHVFSKRGCHSLIHSISLWLLAVAILTLRLQSTYASSDRKPNANRSNPDTRCSLQRDSSISTRNRFVTGDCIRSSKTMPLNETNLKEQLTRHEGNGGAGIENVDPSMSSSLSHVTPVNKKLDDVQKKIETILREEAHGYDILSPNNVSKRSKYLSWDDYFLAVAYLSAQRSKDPYPTNNSHGACIVDSLGRIVGIGYSGFPRGCSDDCLPWASSEEERKEKLAWLHTREPYLCHAEINAILNKCSSDVIGGRMFVPNFPCNESAKFIIQSGIKEIIYVKDDHEDSDSSRASRVLLKLSGVKITKIKSGVPFVRIHLGIEESKDGDAATGEVNNCIQTEERDEEVIAGHRELLIREASYDPLNPPVKKKADYLCWDDYFMAVAFLSAKRSKDPNTQVGACIVDSNKCIIGIGYNGFPRGCSDDHLPWARSAPCGLHRKYPFVVHAEVNAILNKCSADVRNATLYVALFPCNECAKVIIQSGIREVVYLKDHYHNTDSCRASRIMFEMAGVKTRCHKPQQREILINMGC